MTARDPHISLPFFFPFPSLSAWHLLTLLSIYTLSFRPYLHPYFFPTHSPSSSYFPSLPIFISLVLSFQSLCTSFSLLTAHHYFHASFFSFNYPFLILFFGFSLTPFFLSPSGPCLSIIFFFFPFPFSSIVIFLSAYFLLSFPTFLFTPIQFSSFFHLFPSLFFPFN